MSNIRDLRDEQLRKLQDKQENSTARKLQDEKRRADEQKEPSLAEKLRPVKQPPADVAEALMKRLQDGKQE